MRWRRLVAAQMLLGIIASALLAGCERKLERHEPPLAQSRIRKLAAICSKFTVKQKRKPASMEEVKAWVKKLSPTELSELGGIEDADVAFVSPRDHELYVLVKSGGSGPGDVLAYEKIGEEGKHYIVTPMGASFELEKAELQRRVPSAK